jgi:DNA-directed RNA polymerase subunit M
MDFCPKCGSRLVPTPKSGKKKAAVIYACPKCGYEKGIKGKDAEALPKVIEHRPQEQIAVISHQENPQTMPTIKITCPKCRHNEASWWLVQTRGADESPTQFYRCIKCGYTWREYS